MEEKIKENAIYTITKLLELLDGDCLTVDFNSERALDDVLIIQIGENIFYKTEDHNLSLTEGMCWQSLNSKHSLTSNTTHVHLIKSRNHWPKNINTLKLVMKDE